MINPLHPGRIPARVPANSRVQPQGAIKYVFEKFAELGGGTHLKSPEDMFVKSGEETYFYTLHV